MLKASGYSCPYKACLRVKAVDPVVERSPSRNKALGSIPNIGEKKNQQGMVVQHLGGKSQGDCHKFNASLVVHTANSRPARAT